MEICSDDLNNKLGFSTKDDLYHQQVSELKQMLTECGFKVYPFSDLGMVLFQCDNIDYFAVRFCNEDNMHNDKITLVTTVINDEKYFQIVVTNPNFPTCAKEFVDKFVKEHKEYAGDFDNFINMRVNNLLNIAEECDTKDRLVELVKTCRPFVAYNGFEPSGRIHIAQAIVTVLNTNTIIENGGRMIIYIADWFAQLNHKMGGDIEKIQEVGKYFIEVFKACGLNQKGTEFVWASEFINLNKNYLPRILDVSIKNSLTRIKKCCQIMGRKDDDKLSSSQIIYPCMQCADIFELVPGGVDICQLGVDQRKVNMLAIEYAHSTGLKIPIALSHHMLMGLKGKGNKMSKSDPQSAIFMEDSVEEVRKKIASAFCTDEVTDNPIFEYIKYIVLRWFKKITLCGKEYTDIDEIIKDFPDMNKKNLKADVAEYINQILEPVRRHFDNPALKELAEKVAGYRITR